MPKRNFFLHCDDCHHEVHFEGSMTKAHVGYPCPICNANMLTEQDFRRGVVVQASLSVLEALGLVRIPAAGEDTPPGFKKVRIHGENGVVSMSELDE